MSARLRHEGSDMARGARGAFVAAGFGLLILAGCAPPATLWNENQWLKMYNRWNQTLDQVNSGAAAGAADTPRGYRLLRDSTRAALDSLIFVSPNLRRKQAPLLYTFLQRVRYNLLATESDRLDSRVMQLGKLAGRVDSLTGSGDFASAERCRGALDRDADSLDLVVRDLLREDLRSAWDTLRTPFPRSSSSNGEFETRWLVDGDSIPPDPGETRARLVRLNAAARGRQREIALRRPDRLRSGWICRANALVEELNAAVGLDAAGNHREALRRLTAVRDSAGATLAEMAADTTWWPGRPTSAGLSHPPRAPGDLPSSGHPSVGVPSTAAAPSPPSDPDSAVREVLRLVELNWEAISYSLAVGLYQDISRRLATREARPRTDAARLDSVLADPRLESDLRRMIVGLRKDLGAGPSRHTSP